MLVAWFALGLSIATTIFWVGYYFGSLRGQMNRLRTRMRDLEQAYELVSDRKFKTRFPQDEED